MTNYREPASIIIGCSFAAALVVMPANLSANEAGMDTPPVILAQAEQFDDETILGFATAQARVAELQAYYSAQYELVETDEQRLQISGQATQEMVAAVEETPNITLDEYNAIVEAASQDAALVERINEAIADPDT
jgi:hypothetical protein